MEGYLQQFFFFHVGVVLHSNKFYVHISQTIKAISTKLTVKNSYEFIVHISQTTKAYCERVPSTSSYNGYIKN